MAYEMEPMLDLFIYESEQLLDNLETVTMDVEETGDLSDEMIQEIFRAMHTIKGSSAMMMFDEISSLAHGLEDIFDLIRSDPDLTYDISTVVDYTLQAVDYIKQELGKIKNSQDEDLQPATDLKNKIKAYLGELKGMDPETQADTDETNYVKSQQYFIPSQRTTKSSNHYSLMIHFSEDCTMENVRAFTLMNALKAFATSLVSEPSELLEEDDQVIAQIRKKGLVVHLASDEEQSVIEDYLMGYPYVKSYEVKDVDQEDQTSESQPDQKPEEMKAKAEEAKKDKQEKKPLGKQKNATTKHTKMISVDVEKLDILMDLVGELVVSESMVSRNKEVTKVMDNDLEKAIRQHRKIIDDVQDISMAIRMVPLSGTFGKMRRLVRDVSKNQNKEIELVIVGEQTEVDKNIIEKLSDPLMHLVRNACDHGIESPQVRKQAGKNALARVTLEAKNAGGDVLIIVEDDGAGVDPDQVYKKVIEKGLLSEEAPRPSDKQLLNYIFKAGFSTKQEVSEYSGRGVGMDVAVRNIEQLGGTISVESDLGKGSRFIIKIPLTLSIIEGMRLRVADREFIIPITSIQESFKARKEQYVKDPNNGELILYRGQSLRLERLSQLYEIEEGIQDITEGIVIIVGEEDQWMCLFADELVGEQQVVVKPMPKYMKQVVGLSGCAILGDGGISLILDSEGLLKNK